MLQTLRKGGVTIIIVTHDMSLVSQYADRLLLLCEGRVAFDGTPAELFQGAMPSQWRMERPPVWNFSRKLRGLLGDFPIFLKAGSCVAYLDSLTDTEAQDA